VARIRAALAPATHKTLKSWRGLKRAIAALTDADLAEAREFELLGRRRTEHLKLIDIEMRKRAGDYSDRRFKVEERI
jgi:hypothetical protein